MHRHRVLVRPPFAAPRLAARSDRDVVIDALAGFGERWLVDGLAPRVVATMTAGERAIGNLAWLRDSLETSVLRYFNHPRLSAHGPRLAADARTVGAHPYVDVLGWMATAGADGRSDLGWDHMVLAVIDELEAELLELEAVHGDLWGYLARYVWATRDRDQPNVTYPRQ